MMMMMMTTIYCDDDHDDHDDHDDCADKATDDHDDGAHKATERPQTRGPKNPTKNTLLPNKSGKLHIP